MRFMRLGLLAAFLSAGLVGLIGCSEDNNKSANLTSLPPGGNQGPPKNPADYYERTKNINPYAGEYPGTKK